jgi:hypothetical protein
MNVPKIFLCLSTVIVMQLPSFAQELEFCGSLNTSSEQRFEKAKGIGLQYQQNILPKYKIGIGTHYNYDNTSFNTSFNGATDVEGIRSNAKRISLRLNIQRLLKDNEYVSLSIGPEISYNYVWSHDDRYYLIYADSSYVTHNTQNIHAKQFGIGFIAKMEIKDFIYPHLALCFNLRPEKYIGNRSYDYGAGRSALAWNISFTEFQIGLKYNFKNM